MRHLLLAPLLSAWLMLPASAAADWPMFQYNPARQGSVERPVIRRPQIHWKMPVGVAGWLNNPVIADGTVFIGSSGQLWGMSESDGAASQDGVYAFQLDTGARRWFAPAKADVNAVVWANSKVFATGDEGGVWALDARNGKVLWRNRELEGEGFQLLPLGQSLLVGDSAGQLLWLDQATGKTRIRSQLDGPIRAGASANGEHVFVATTQGTVYAFTHQGKLVWQQSLRTSVPGLSSSSQQPEIYAAPTLAGDLVVVGYARDTYYPTPALVALDRRSGKLRWLASGDPGKTDWGNIRTSPAVVNNHLVYAEPYSNDIIQVELATGKIGRITAMGAPMFPQWSSPAVSGKVIYQPRFDGGLYALEAGSGQPIWQFYIGEPRLAGPDFPLGLLEQQAEWRPQIGDAVYSSPALAADGRILIAAGGYLYCIGEAR